MLLHGVAAFGLEQHITHEEAVPGHLGNDADREAVLGVRPGEQILHEDVTALQIAGQTRQQGAELLRAEGPVVLPPPDLVLGGAFLDDELVGGGAAPVLAGIDNQRTEMADVAFGTMDGLLVQSSARQVPVCAADAIEAVVVQTVIAGVFERQFSRRRADVEVNVHAQSLTSFRSPR